ncbi:MAG: hypothetical protein AABZ34_04290 [Nitrospirota bacterium]
MQYLSEDQVTQMMGIGYLGEMRQGPDGNLYQYVQGVDGLGNPIGGFWSKFKRGLRKVHSLAQRGASFIPGPYGAAIRAGLKIATPILQKAGVAGNEGIGALYEAPDGSLYQVQGMDADEELRGIGDEAMTQMMGVGYLGEVRQGPDGNLYQYVQGVDGLGNPIGGFWSKLKRGLRKVHSLAQRGASFIPGPYGAAIRAGLKIATPILQKAGVAGYEGLGALYQAPDGTMYQQVHGLNEGEELRGLAEDEELRGLDEDEELRGLDEDEELRGLDAEEELQGFAEDDELRGVGEDQDMQGIDGYVRQDGMSGLEAYVPQEPPQTRWYVAPTQAPEVWKSLW